MITKLLTGALDTIMLPDVLDYKLSDALDSKLPSALEAPKHSELQLTRLEASKHTVCQTKGEFQGRASIRDVMCISIDP